MKAEDVTATLEMSLDAAGLDRARALHLPRLLSDNVLLIHLRRPRQRPCPRGSLSPYDPGQDRALAPALKNRILLENYYLPDALENQIKTFVADYNHRRYHESIANLLTLADVYFGRGQTILLQRQTPDYRSTPLATPTACHITSSTKKGQSLTYLESSLSQKL